MSPASASRSQERSSGYRLGVDVGSCYTKAVLAGPDGHITALSINGSPLLPVADATGEPDPSAALDKIRAEAVRVAGVPAGALTVLLTHPVGRHPAKRAILVEACQRAGLPEPTSVSEPVAAAIYLVEALARPLPTGQAVVVFSFGAATCEVSVVAEDSTAASGYEVLADNTVDDLGGDRLDAALLDWIAARYEQSDEQVWRRLDFPQTPADQRLRRDLEHSIKAARERLSHGETATIALPLIDSQADLDRDEFEIIAEPLMVRTIEATDAAIRAAGVAPSSIAAVLLAGGASRSPVLVRLVRDRLGQEPVLPELPELVFAEGAARLGTHGTGVVRSAAGSPMVPVDPWVGSVDTEPQLVAHVPGGYSAGAAAAYAAGDQLARTAPLPAAEAAPPAKQRKPRNRNPYPGTLVGPKRRRRWVPIVLVAMALLVAGWAYALRSGLVPNGGAPQGLTSPTAAGRTYVRNDPPTWVPNGWTRAIDDATVAAVVAGAAANGGTCVYDAPGILHVRRNAFDVSGCNTTTKVRQLSVTDAAVEAEFSLASGCGAMWLRVGVVGYLVMVCQDGGVELHELAAGAAGSATLRGSWRPQFDPKVVVLGLLGQGKVLTVFVNGNQVGNFIDPSPIAKGRVGIGAFQPSTVTKTDVTITRFRTWVPDVAA